MPSIDLNNILENTRPIIFASVTAIAALAGLYYYYKQRKIAEIEDGVLKGLIISGPSGVGKGTLINKLMQEFPEAFGFSVSHTTRKPREKEVNGVDYHFVEYDLMSKMIVDEEFIEFAEVHGKYYGTSFDSYKRVSESGRICLLDIDVQGAKAIKNSKKINKKPHTIFVTVKSTDDLKSRLLGRGTESEEVINKRVSNARDEIVEGLKAGNYEAVIENDNLETAYNKLKDLILEWYPHLKK